MIAVLMLVVNLRTVGREFVSPFGHQGDYIEGYDIACLQCEGQVMLVVNPSPKWANN